jgi:hypothetical protein
MCVVELEYQYVLSKSSVEEIDFDDWNKSYKGLELVLDYCLEMKIQLYWIEEALEFLQYIAKHFPIAKRTRII